MDKLIRIEVFDRLDRYKYGCSECCFNAKDSISCNKPDDLECSENGKEYYFEESDNAANQCKETRASSQTKAR